MTVAVVVGMASEKAVVGERPSIQVIVGARNAPALASRLEATIAAGADRILSIGVCGALASAKSSSACQFAIVAIPSSIAMMRGRLGSSEH